MLNECIGDNAQIEVIPHPISRIVDRSNGMGEGCLINVQLPPGFGPLQLMDLLGDHDGCVRILHRVVDGASIARGADPRSPIPFLPVGL
jgi:hypothetical protein